MTISTAVLAITDVFGGTDRDAGGSPPKDQGTLKKWLHRLAKCTQKTCRKDR